MGAIVPAAAQLHVDVTQGNIQPLPIAIPDFVAPAPGDASAAANIAGVVRADLGRSGLFKPLDPKSFIEQIRDINTPPQFNSWRVINAQALVTGQAAIQPDGRLRVDFRLWDVYGESQMLGLQYFTTPENWRRIAHMISDAIYQRITGEKGYFDTRIVFISESGPALNRKKRLAVMDEDGANPIFLTNGSYIVLTPRFNPTAQMIAYMSYIGGKPRVYLFDLETGRQQMLGNFPNMTFSPRFSPDGNKVVMSLEHAGNSDIYVMDLAHPGGHAPDTRSGHRHLALLLAGRHPDRLRIRPRRLAAGLCHERGRHECASDQLRQRPGRHAGVEPARRSHRIYQDCPRCLPDRGHASGRLGRARDLGRLAGRRAHLGAQWAGSYVYQDAPERPRQPDLVGGRDRPERAARGHTGPGLRSGLVALDTMMSQF